MRRRSLLGALAATPMLGSCGPTRDSFRDEPDPLAGRLPGTARAILHQAALAPSSHNIQPWTVTVGSETRWTIGADPARRLPAVDPLTLEPVLSIGCFVETLVQAAAGFGVAVEAETVAAANTDTDLVSVTALAGRRERGLVAAIGHRRTVRQGFLERPIEPARISALIGADGESVAFLPRGSREAEWCVEATIAAARAQAARDEAQAELAEWIRFRPAEQRRHRDGLTPATMDLGGVAGFWVSWTYGRETVMGQGFRARGIARAEAEARAGGGWLVLTAADQGPAAVIEAGRAWQRLWLRTPEMAIGLHPMSYAIQERGGREAAREALGLSRPVMGLLRIGHVADYARPVSLRRPPAAWVRFAET